MGNRILFVDDELNILEGYRRQFRKEFEIEIAQSGEQGLQAIAGAGPFAVVVSDFRMPGMNGIEFLTRVREAAPDTVRMMLTGFAEIQAVIEAINEGNVFRFLTKPCTTEVMARALNEGLKQYQLITSERELLEKTLKGTIEVLTEVLSLVNPEAFGRASRITRYVREIAEQLGQIGPADRWALETAAMLSQIGCILLPQEAIKKLYQGESLSSEEFQIFQMHPGIAHDLLKQIPRLEPVAEIVLYQEKGFDGSGIPLDNRQGETIPLGARILKAVLDFDILTTRGESRGKALLHLSKESGLYDPLVLSSFEKVLGTEAKFDRQALSVVNLREKMILEENIWSLDGTKKILSKGHELSSTILEHLRKFQDLFGIQEPVKVMVPLTRDD
ncbi:MAG: response regulator [Deltaproteobacteria bacterium]|nr:response regulator [Deltaproteobacteria bacterium]